VSKPNPLWDENNLLDPNDPSGPDANGNPKYTPQATAKITLVVNADGHISGYRASATSNPLDGGSTFSIFADTFYVAGTPQGNNVKINQQPFGIVAGKNGNPNQISFNGRVEFSNIDGGEKIVTQDTINVDLARTTTVINGSRITTGVVNANLITTGTLNANRVRAGSIVSTNGAMEINLDKGWIYIS